MNDQTRALPKRFAAADKGIYPTMVHAGVYASVLHYLKAVEALKSDDGTKVIAKMKEMPTDDPLFGKGTIRADGRKIHPAYLVQVKKPRNPRRRGTTTRSVATIPGGPGVPAARRRRLPAGQEMTQLSKSKMRSLVAIGDSCVIPDEREAFDDPAIAIDVASDSRLTALR